MVIQMGISYPILCTVFASFINEKLLMLADVLFYLCYDLSIVFVI